jgi:branched-chain amino acid transport system ATP-binding protein
VSALEVRNVSVRFGGHLALHDVGLTAEAGRITGLIGPNGAGKTTLFNVICGLQPPTRGQVAIDGRDVTRLLPYRRARAGLARTFQRLELFSLLTVRGNVRVAASAAHRRGGVERVVDEILDRVGLRALADVRADELPTGHARLVELARALASQPRVLLLDEPASGQDEQETESVAGLLRSLASDDGIAVLLVEHDMQLVMRTCEWVHVLDFGEVLASGTPSEIQHDERVVEAYLGSPA